LLSNHLLAAAIKSCGSEHKKEKASEERCQVGVNEDEHFSELLLEASKMLDDVKTNVQYRHWDKQ
jgi:hypothetical protein